MANDKKILPGQSVRIGEDVYMPGDEDELDEVLPAEDVERLMSLGVIEGDFKGVDEDGNAGPGVKGQPLPEDFPGRKALENAGVTTVEDLRKMSDKDIDGLAKVKPETKDRIRAARDAEQ